MSELHQDYVRASQAQVLDFWSKLSDEEQKQLDAQLTMFNPEEVNKNLKHALNTKETPSEITPLPVDQTASVINSQPAQIAEWRNVGLEAIKKGKVAVLLLAGGQGTRLGSSAPKGCYDVNLPSKSSLFELQARRIAKIAQLAQAESDGIPWYIMTSGPTKAPTKEFFESHKYFGLDPKNVVFFEQGVLPCTTSEGKILLETPSKVSVAPDGNGGVYKALSRSGALKDMQSRGIEHIHMYCVDNSLVKVADPVFIGYAASHDFEIATKVVRKRSAEEPVGLIVAKDNKPSVIEYSEISHELAEATEPDSNLLKFRAANIVNHYYSMRFLSKSEELAGALPFHVAHKKIPCASESGETIKPSKPNGIKLEQFVFDVFPQVSLKKFGCLEVSREGEFSPVKNAPGSAEDCPETARSDVMREGQRWLTAVGANCPNPVEITPAVSYGGEGLESFKGEDIGVVLLS